MLGLQICLAEGSALEGELYIYVCIYILFFFFRKELIASALQLRNYKVQAPFVGR